MNSLARHIAAAAVRMESSVLTSTLYVTASDDHVITPLSQTAAEIASRTKAKQLYSFVDKRYNRSSWVFGGSAEQLRETCGYFAEAVVRTLRKAAPQGSGSTASSFTEHPQLGLLDHICFQPLFDTPLADAAVAARAASESVASSAGIPCFLYGPPAPAVVRCAPRASQASQGDAGDAASAGHGLRTLADIRRASGRYFLKPGTPAPPFPASFLPDVRPSHAPTPTPTPTPIDPSIGVCCVGYQPYILNYNVQVHAVRGNGNGRDDNVGGTAEDVVDTEAFGSAVQRISRAVSTRGGGLPHVEALGLPYTVQRISRAVSTHGGGLPHVEALGLPYTVQVVVGQEDEKEAGVQGSRTGRQSSLLSEPPQDQLIWEVACNLLSPDSTPPQVVLGMVQELVAQHNKGVAGEEERGRGAGQVKLRVGRDYSIGLTKAAAQAAYLSAINPAS